MAIMDGGLTFGWDSVTTANTFSYEGTPGTVGAALSADCIADGAGLYWQLQETDMDESAGKWQLYQWCETNEGGPLGPQTLMARSREEALTEAGRAAEFAGTKIILWAIGPRFDLPGDD